MTAVSPEQVADYMRAVVEEAGTPHGHTGPLSVQQITYEAARVLGFPQERVKRFWHRRAAVRADEIINAQAKLEAHRAQIERRRAKADALAEQYRQVRDRALSLHASVAAVLPPPLDDPEA